ncbi:MAG: hypothetical protein AB7P69_05125 [Candidatus Binatia bacterium]
MADVNLIINSLNTIANAAYHKVHDGPPSSRKTGHQIAFEALQGTAAQLAAVFGQNPAPNRDSRENIAAQFATMKKNVDVYCVKTVETRPVLIAFNNASTEWEVLRSELGD